MEMVIGIIALLITAAALAMQYHGYRESPLGSGISQLIERWMILATGITSLPITCWALLYGVIEISHYFSEALEWQATIASVLAIISATLWGIIWTLFILPHLQRILRYKVPQLGEQPTTKPERTTDPVN